MANRIGAGVAAAAEPLPVIELGHLFPNYRPRLNREAAAAAADAPAAQQEMEESVPEVNAGEDAVAMNGGNEDLEDYEATEKDDDSSDDASRGLNNGVVAAAAAASTKEGAEHESASSNDQTTEAAANDQSLEQQQQQQARPASLSNNHETPRKRAATAADGTEPTKKRTKRKLVSWEERLEQLKAYKKEHGHCRVPRSYTPNPSLGRWVAHQRTAYRKAKSSGTSVAPGLKRISDDRISQLEELGFVWKVIIKVPSWADRIGQLEAYKKEHGDCRVPLNYTPNPSLGRWVATQRKAYRKAKSSGTSVPPGLKRISDDRISQLEELGFVWKVRDSPINVPWADRIDQLKAYKHEHGDCRVPLNYTPNPSLGQWVKTQREAHRNSSKPKSSGTSVAPRLKRISDDRIAQLEELGFVWKVRDSPIKVPWADRIDQLKAYKHEHGDCLVPRNYTPNPSLGQWVAHQRTAYRLKKITDGRISQLEAIGFVWSLRGP